MAYDTDELQLTLRLAGFTLAPAACSVSDGETLCTLAITENGTNRKIHRFEGEIAESIEVARHSLAEMQAEGEAIRWALAFDGYTNINGERTDALIVQVASGADNLPARIAQNYRPASLLRRFRITGHPQFLSQTSVVTEDSQYREWLLEGVMDHPKAASLWKFA